LREISHSKQKSPETLRAYYCRDDWTNLEHLFFGIKENIGFYKPKQELTRFLPVFPVSAINISSQQIQQPWMRILQFFGRFNRQNIFKPGFSLHKIRFFPALQYMNFMFHSSVRGQKLSESGTA
jgi:hypothetical protein